VNCGTENVDLMLLGATVMLTKAMVTVEAKTSRNRISRAFKFILSHLLFIFHPEIKVLRWKAKKLYGIQF